MSQYRGGARRSSSISRARAYDAQALCFQISAAGWKCSAILRTGVWDVEMREAISVWLYPQTLCIVRYSEAWKVAVKSRTHID